MKYYILLWLVFSFISISQPFPYSVEVNVGQVSWVSPQQWINFYYYENPGYELYGIDITNCSNGDFIILGHSTDLEYGLDSSLLVRINTGGEVLWSLLFDLARPQGLIHQANETFLLVGENNINGQKYLEIVGIEGLTGTILWSKNHSLFIEHEVRAVTGTNDHGLFVGCNLDDQILQNRTWIGLRFDLNGNLLWNRTYAEHNPGSQCIVTDCEDGSFLLVGQETSAYYIGYQLVAYRLESDGTVRWIQLYEDTIPYDVVESPSGGFLILGEKGIRIDDGGNQLWNKTFWLSGRWGSITSCDNGFLLTGVGDNPIIHESVYAVRIDNDGGVLWQWSHGIALYFAPYCAVVTIEESGFFIIANADVFQLPAILLIRLPEVPVPTQMLFQLYFNSYLVAFFLLILISIALIGTFLDRVTINEPFRKIYQDVLSGNLLLYAMLSLLWLSLWLTGPVYPIIGHMQQYPPNAQEILYQFQNALVTPSANLFFFTGIALAFIFQGIEFLGAEKPKLQQNQPVKVIHKMIIYIIIAIAICALGMGIIYLVIQNPWTWNIYLQQSFFVFPIILLGLLTAAWFPKLLFFRIYEKRTRREATKMEKAP